MSNALLVVILTALFCSFWSLLMKVVLQHPQTDEQYLKCGSIMLLYKFFKMFCGKNCFACSNTPKARETFLEIVSTCYFQVTRLSIWRPRYFVSFKFWILVSRIFKSNSPNIFWCFWRDKIFMETVLTVFNDSLFPLSQWPRLSRSFLTVSFSWSKLAPRVSSAYMATVQFSMTLGRPLI